MKTMRKWLCLLAAAALLLGCLTGCGEKKEEEASAPDSQTEAASEPAAANESANEATTEQENSATVGGEEPEVWSAPALAALESLRESARETGAVCAGAYVGWFDSEAYEQSGSLLNSMSAVASLFENYPFLEEIPPERQLVYPGQDIYCLLPTEEAEIIVYSCNYDWDTGSDSVTTEEIGRFAGSDPVLITCNVSDIMSNIEINVVSGDGSSFSFQPKLSLRDGSPGWPEAILDFSCVPSSDDCLWLSDTISLSGTYTDEVNGTYSFSYSLPYIEGLETDYINQINAEIAALREQYIDPQLKYMDEGSSLVVPWARYQCGWYQGIWSLMVEMCSDWGSNYYRIWHFDQQGNEVSNEALLQACGMSGEAFTAAAKARLESWITLPEGLSDDSMTAALTALRDKTLSADNCNADMPIFVDSTGTVSFVARVYSAAGADYYDHYYVLVPEQGFQPWELSRLALDYYQSAWGYRPGVIEIESESADGKITLKLYDDYEDHITSYAHYEIDSMTGTGTDLVNFWDIDLTAR